MAVRTLFDLAGAEDERRFSPYCWRTRMALAHKGLTVDTVPWRFTEKAAIAPSAKVPVLIDGETTIADSWAIAIYLEETYPDAPSLFGAPAAIPVTRFLNAWADRVLVPGIAPLIVRDIHDCLHEKDQAYFRTSREKAFGATLEQVMANRETRVEAFRRSLDPLRLVLRTQPFVGGAAPTYADYIAFGTLQWPRCTSSFPLLEPADPISAWFDTMLDLFDGLGRRAMP